IIPPISLSTTFKLAPSGKADSPYYYTEAGNPTRTALEENLAALENAGHCRIFPSGMAAIFSITMLVKSGEHILADEDIYADTISLIKKILQPTHGIEITFTEFTDIYAVKKSLKENTKLVFFESPTNPTLKVIDVEEVTKTVKNFNRDICVVVDNTFISPYFQRPLSFDVDMVIHSCTKYINGHADVLMGAVMTNCEKLDQHLYQMQKYTISLIKKILQPTHRIEITFTEFTDINAVKKSLKENTKLVLFESPTNPTLKVIDIEEVTKAVKNFNKDIFVVVDNTFISPYFQRPLSFDVDMVIHSCTKYINGHADVLMGAVMTNCEKLDQHLYQMQKCTGSVPSAFDCYLVMRGTKTLHVRMRTHMENAIAVAKFLETCNQIEKVLYPLLESHPQHQIHMKQARGMSGMISFYIKDDEDGSATKMFLNNLQLIQNATSLGAAESLIVRCDMKYEEFSPPLRKGVANNLVRLSVGLEEKEDIIEDLKQALDSITDASGNLESKSGDNHSDFELINSTKGD
uniref:cystathionine gamma-lyase n=1 Tax=Acrobeloides nanus TaxID=290746 RepID=A0A914CCM5_9BILA